MTPGCAEGFKALNPAIKIVIVVRDPFLRLLSDYHHEERIAEKFGRTPEEGWWSFEEMVLTPKGEVGYHVILSATQCWKITVCRINTALSSNFAHEVTRFFFFKIASVQVNDTSYIISPSLYTRHIDQWHSAFGRENVFIVDGDNLIKRPWEEMVPLQEFLGLETEIYEGSYVFNEEKK